MTPFRRMIYVELTLLFRDLGLLSRTISRSGRPLKLKRAKSEHNNGGSLLALFDTNNTTK
jgi:hypothetical protein